MLLIITFLSLFGYHGNLCTDTIPKAKDTTLVAATVSDTLSKPDSTQARLTDDQFDDMLIEAVQLFNREKYTQSAALLEVLEKQRPNLDEIEEMLGICYLKTPGHHERALKYLNNVHDIKAIERHPQYYFYMAEAHQLNLNFDSAIVFYTKYLDNQKLKPEEKEMVYKLISQSQTGMEFMSKPDHVKIYSLSDSINTEFTEHSPVISSDGRRLFFTHKGSKSTGGLMNEHLKTDLKEGEYYEDLFISEFKTDHWSLARPITQLNTHGHDASVGMSPDGHALLFYYFDKKNNGDIMISEIDSNGVYGKPLSLDGVNTPKYWEGSASLSADGNVIYFSSDRPGGQGGKDIWMAKRTEDGKWTNVTNMGPTINTAGDEDAPFIHASNEFLFFSSDGHQTMGGQDIFRSDYDGVKWGNPYNLGFPINTADDDIFYCVTADGSKGYFSSGRNGTKGQYDIFCVEPGIIGNPVKLVQVKGNVTLDGKPVLSNIYVNYKESKDLYGKYQSSAQTGDYVINLPVGASYKLWFETDMHLELMLIETQHIDTFALRHIDVNFHSFKKIRKPTTPQGDVKQISIDEFTADGVNSRSITTQEEEQIKYAVQIGAYVHPEGFKPEQYKDLLGEPKSIVLEDQVTRFIVGDLTTYAKAQELKEKAVGAGLTDAFIIAVLNGKRIIIK